MKNKDIKDLKGYHKNPRKMTSEDFSLLSSSLKEFGDLSGIIVNKTTGEVIGGNQRTSFFKQQPEGATIAVVESFTDPTATGTVALGYVLYKGEKYNYREVEWDEKKEERANILANKVGGTWDFDTLANAFDVDMLLASGWKSFELGFATTKEQDGKDTDGLKESMDTYLTGSVKQVTFYFSSEEYEVLLPRLDKVMTEIGVKSHTEVFLKLLDEHESN